MYYVIQEGMFKEEGHIALVNILERHGFEYEEILFRPFVEGLDLRTTRTDVFVFGSVNLNKKIAKYKLVPGTLDNANHDFNVYASHYKEHMLNHDGKVIKFGDPLPEEYIGKEFFARPTKDTKVFSGQVFTPEEWNEWQKNMADSNVIQNLKAETEILIAPPKNMYQEIRCWVVGGKVVTMSQYKIGYRVIAENMDNFPEAREFAQKMVDIFAPAEAFVIDICQTAEGWRVVEINCINSAGFYKGDMSKLIQAIENHWS